MAKVRKIKTPEEAIKAKCWECSNGNRLEVDECNILTCPLWPYRKGFDQKEFPMKKESKDLWETDIEIEEE